MENLSQSQLQAIKNQIAKETKEKYSNDQIREALQAYSGEFNSKDMAKIVINFFDDSGGQIEPNILNLKIVQKDQLEDFDQDTPPESSIVTYPERVDLVASTARTVGIELQVAHLEAIAESLGIIYYDSLDDIEYFNNLKNKIIAKIEEIDDQYRQTLEAFVSDISQKVSQSEQLRDSVHESFNLNVSQISNNLGNLSQERKKRSQATRDNISKIFEVPTSIF